MVMPVLVGFIVLLIFILLVRLTTDMALERGGWFVTSLSVGSMALFVLFVVLFVLWWQGLRKEESKTIQEKEDVAIQAYLSRDDFGVETVGNMSWLPLHIDGIAAHHTSFILTAVQRFEESHPELELLSTQVTESLGHGARVFGVWIYHRPKKEVAAEVK